MEPTPFPLRGATNRAGRPCTRHPATPPPISAVSEHARDRAPHPLDTDLPPLDLSDFDSRTPKIDATLLEEGES